MSSLAVFFISGALSGFLKSRSYCLVSAWTHRVPSLDSASCPPHLHAVYAAIPSERQFHQLSKHNGYSQGAFSSKDWRWTRHTSTGTSRATPVVLGVQMDQRAGQCRTRKRPRQCRSSPCRHGQTSVNNLVCLATGSDGQVSQSRPHKGTPRQQQGGEMRL